MKCQKGDKVFSLQIILLQFGRQVVPWMSLCLCPEEVGCVCVHVFQNDWKGNGSGILAFDVCYYRKMENAEMLSYTQGSSLVCYLLMPELFY